MKYLLTTLATLLTLSTFCQMDFKAINETKYLIYDSTMVEVFHHKRAITFFLTPKTLVICHVPTSDWLPASDTLQVKSLTNVDDKAPRSKKHLFTKIITKDKITVLIWDTHVSVAYPKDKKTKSSLLMMYDRPQ